MPEDPAVPLDEIPVVVTPIAAPNLATSGAGPAAGHQPPSGSGAVPDVSADPVIARQRRHRASQPVG